MDPHPEVHGPQEQEDAHTVAHAASDLSGGVGNGGLLNGGLGLEAVGATDRVEDAWLGLGFRGEDWGPLVWARTYMAGAGWMVLEMPAMSRKAADSPKKMTMMACGEREKRRRVGAEWVRGGAHSLACSRGQSDRPRQHPWPCRGPTRKSLSMSACRTCYLRVAVG